MKLSLNGQWGEVSGLIYTYPDANSSEIPEWAKTLFDPRNAVRGIFKGDYCYALWYNNNGYYYSCIKTNTDSRNGCVMLTVFAGDMVPMDGEQIAEKMRMMLDYCLLKNDYTEINNNPDTLLKARDIEVLLTKRALPEDTSSTSEKEMAYRLYKNKAELGLIMENPYQPSYAGYKRILILEESAFGGEAVFSQSITQITESVKKTYDVRSDSNDVRPSKESVMEGEIFGITYRKAGYADEYKEVQAGRPCANYTIDGNIINLKSASAVGITFMKEITLQVVDEETKSPIKKWSFTIDSSIRNDVRGENSDGCVSCRIDPNKSHKIEFFADGYENKMLELAAGEHGLKTVRLHSSDVSVFVRLQSGKEEYAGSVRMKSNNELYKPLKWLDEKNNVLQVKRGFFSRRNLVPILLVFAIAAAAGVFLGRVTKKTSAGVDNGNDSTLVAQLQERINSLNAEIDGMKKAEEQNNAIDSKLFSFYGRVLSLIDEKNKIDVTKVNDILSQAEFSILLIGKETDKNILMASLNELITQLNAVVGGDGGVVSPKGSVVNRQIENEKITDDLNYFAANPDTWDLSELKSDKYGTKFAGYIKSADILNLIEYTGNASNNDYYGNENWQKICVNLKKFWDNNQNDKGKVDQMKANIQRYVTGNIFDLNRLADSDYFK